MCTIAIVDTDSLWKLAPKEPIHGKLDAELYRWIDQRHGILAYTSSGKYSEELDHSWRVRMVFEEYRRGGQAVLVGSPELERAANRLDESKIRSNDRHMLALALASDALVLCSGDKRLKEDFVNTSILPNVGRVQRAVYPRDSSDTDRHQFLQQRECPNRVKS